jgi:hypothetical protein
VFSRTLQHSSPQPSRTEQAWAAEQGTQHCDRGDQRPRRKTPTEKSDQEQSGNMGAVASPPQQRWIAPDEVHVAICAQVVQANQLATVQHADDVMAAACGHRAGVNDQLDIPALGGTDPKFASLARRVLLAPPHRHVDEPVDLGQLALTHVNVRIRNSLCNKGTIALIRRGSTGRVRQKTAPRRAPTGHSIALGEFSLAFA